MPGFRPKGKAILKVPVDLMDTIRSSELSAVVTTEKIKGMFEPVEPVFAKPSIKRVKPAVLPKAAKVVNTVTENLSVDKVVDKDKKPRFSGDLEELRELILDEESNDTVYNELPKNGYVPTSRRGFSSFIKENYASFMLDPTTTADPDQEKYPYQRFIREYMRNDSPYRGVLTYHGLGSGKTCTAIATAEALYSRGNKKIIVMTPFSLRKNFLKEVSLCGFRHFRTNNFWSSMPVDDEDARLFATTVLGIPESHLKTAKNIWIPDFRKEEPNYKDLDAYDQTEIRKQILSILIWDAKKNPNGRIRFINYNGITSKALKEIACSSSSTGFFDDSVIIIDEVHNIVRLMQGTIDPYLLDLPGKKRVISKEVVTVKKWKPSLCANTSKNYMRGYLFYRLLLDASNSKIIGLSGTPIINFPEELGILMNVLHGYIPTIKFTVGQVGYDVQKQLKTMFAKESYTDFVLVENDMAGKGSVVTITLLPQGIRKIQGSEGVERMGPDQKIPTIDEIIGGIQELLDDAKFTVNGNISTVATQLLPPFGEDFRNAFINDINNADNDNIIKNKIVLVKRISGLISYYKGSNVHLMPRIKSDKVVRVPMSVISQKGYVLVRNEEISKEKTKKGAAGEVGGAWAEVFEVGSGKQTSNYKMASRQACNFVFPSDVIRPKPKTKREVMREADNGHTREDIIDATPDSLNVKDAEGFPELDEELDEDENYEAIDEEEEGMLNELEGDVPQTGGGEEVVEVVEGEGEEEEVVEGEGEEVVDGEGEEVVEEVVKPVEKPVEQIVPPIAPVPARKFVPTSLKAKLESQTLKESADCKTGVNEPYKEATARSKQCLATIAKYCLKLGGENGLELHSPKFAKILENINAIEGSHLVYSQFLDMEGIGIFSLAMNANGFSPIEITNAAGGPVFTKATIDSLSKGPGGQSRYMTFSGGEDEDIRRLYLNIFNANLDELPHNIKSVLETYHFKNNHLGDIAKVFCITSAGAEGLSLKCVRGVHIMEPYWNDVRLKQVKGRAIRIGSHLELPEADRNVSIFTYLSCFSQEAQVQKTGDMRIDETIRNTDAIESTSAKKLGLPVAESASQYVLTTDERIYEVAMKKKKITEALENIMKSAAVDCEINIKENKDESFQCLSLDGAVGDFLYHPDLETDIRESASKYSIKETPKVATTPAAVKPVEPAKPIDYIKKALKGVIYRMKEIKKDGVLVGFEMYEDLDDGKLLGTSGAKDGKPSPPVKFIEKSV
jgi:hypothetical protein